MRVYGLFGGSQEFSVAYFGFDNEDTLKKFISKYDNFIIEIDNKQKFVLQVIRATFQAMPSIREDETKIEDE